MVQKELYCINEKNGKLYRTYSTDGYFIIQIETSTKYKEAIDPENAPYTYEETDEKIIIDNEELEETEE